MAIVFTQDLLFGGWMVWQFEVYHLADLFCIKFKVLQLSKCHSTLASFSPLMFLSSSRVSFITDETLIVDGGYLCNA